MKFSSLMLSSLALLCAGACAGEPSRDMAGSHELDQICGTLGASYLDPTHWMLFRKREHGERAIKLCLDDDCGIADLTDGYYQRSISAQASSTHRLTASR